VHEIPAPSAIRRIAPDQCRQAERRPGRPASLSRVDLAEEDTMLWDASMLVGYATVGSDGAAGTVSGLLFDDAIWRLRWLVADTREWLPRHEVLIPAAALGRPDPLRRRLAVDLTMAQIEDCPAADRHPPVSCQTPSARHADLHLRSVDAVVGHRVHLVDAVIGHVQELVVDDAGWDIRYIRVDTCKWRPGDRVLLAPRSVREIDWHGRFMRFDVGRQQVEAGRSADCEAIWMRSQGYEPIHSEA
jgi:hypothetical protein